MVTTTMVIVMILAGAGFAASCWFNSAADRAARKSIADLKRR